MALIRRCRAIGQGAGPRHDQVPTGDERLLVGRRDYLAGIERCQHGPEADGPARGDHDEVDIRARGQAFQRVIATLQRDARWDMEPDPGVRVRDRGRGRPDRGELCAERLVIGTGGKRHDLESVGRREQHVDGLPPDRPGRAEHGHAGAARHRVALVR